MLQVRSITPHRVAITTTHHTQSKAKIEMDVRRARGDYNVMIVPARCKHTHRDSVSVEDAEGINLCFRCVHCGMITNFDLPPSVFDEEVSE